jgi:hypothetical protein
MIEEIIQSHPTLVVQIAATMGIALGWAVMIYKLAQRTKVHVEDVLITLVLISTFIVAVTYQMLLLMGISATAQAVYSFGRADTR